MQQIIVFSLALMFLNSPGRAQEPSQDFIELMQMLGQKAAPESIDLNDPPEGSMQFQATAAGSVCYIAPCDRPLDGTRWVCVRDSSGSCASCGWERDRVCDP